jgi:hypothetical protein
MGRRVGAVVTPIALQPVKEFRGLPGDGRQALCDPTWTAFRLAEWGGIASQMTQLHLERLCKHVALCHPALDEVGSVVVDDGYIARFEPAIHHQIGLEGVATRKPSAVLAIDKSLFIPTRQVANQPYLHDSSTRRLLADFCGDGRFIQTGMPSFPVADLLAALALRRCWCCRFLMSWRCRNSLCPASDNRSASWHTTLL